MCSRTPCSFVGPTRRGPADPEHIHVARGTVERLMRHAATVPLPHRTGLDRGAVSQPGSAAVAGKQAVRLSPGSFPPDSTERAEVSPTYRPRSVAARSRGSGRTYPGAPALLVLGVRRVDQRGLIFLVGVCTARWWLNVSKLRDVFELAADTSRFVEWNMRDFCAPRIQHRPIMPGGLCRRDTSWEGRCASVRRALA